MTVRRMAARRARLAGCGCGGRRATTERRSGRLMKPSKFEVRSSKVTAATPRRRDAVTPVTASAGCRMPDCHQSSAFLCWCCVLCCVVLCCVVLCCVVAVTVRRRCRRCRRCRRGGLCRTCVQNGKSAAGWSVRSVAGRVGVLPVLFGNRRSTMCPTIHLVYVHVLGGRGAVIAACQVQNHAGVLTRSLGNQF